MTSKRSRPPRHTPVQVNLMKNEEIREYLTYLTSPKRIFWTNFLAGTSRGLGFILGTVLVLAILTFVISQVLSEIPWVGELFRWLDDWMRENISSYTPA